jgi:prophage antirepressor-like protein
MSELSLSTYQHDQFGEIRTLLNENGEPWFVAKEVAVALGYKNSRGAIIEHCKGGSEMLLPSKGGNQMTKVIPESDLYRLILRSKLPQAEAFQDWVTSEVLPSIRKYGIYKKDKKEELTEKSFLEHNGFFWLSLDTLKKQMEYIGLETEEDNTDNIGLTFDENKDFLKVYYAEINGKSHIRDYGILYLLLTVSFEVLEKKEEIKKLCTRVESLLESLKGKDTNHIKISAVRAYQEVVSKITASGKDINFIAGLIRYKKKELTPSEIAVLTGQKEDDVAVYLEELEASGIMDMADFFVDTLPTQISPPALLPSTPVQPEPVAFQVGVSKKLIKALGFNEAVVLNQLETMIAESKRDSVTVTYDEWIERFPFKSWQTLRRVVRKLEKKGIVIADIDFSHFIRVKRYRIDRETLRRYAGE